MSQLGTKYSYIPWLRRGLSRQISNNEVDTLGKSDGATLKRASLSVKGTFDLLSAKNEGKKVVRSETIKVGLVGPGEVLGVNPMAVMQAVPANGVKNFESNYFPFVEFFEEDIPWRYTPAKETSDKLRPWLALLVCKRDEYDLTTDSEGNKYVSLKINDNKVYQDIFQDPEKTWNTAHVQFANEELQKSNLKSKVNTLLDRDDDIAISRILSTRNLEDNTAYTVFLVPSFETGRLSGLGMSFDTVPAQRAAWEKNLDKQRNRQRAFDFPVYYHWEFETSTGDFIVLAKKLKPITTEGLPAALKVDVQNMGNGLNYSIFKDPPKRKLIDIAVATTPVGFTSVPFPSRTDEEDIAFLMKDLLSNSPDLVENIEQTTEKSRLSASALRNRDLRRALRLTTKLVLQNQKRTSRTNDKSKTRLPIDIVDISKSTHLFEGDEMDDPWIVPPLYGAKHIMATSLEDSENKNHPWFTQLNLDVRHRAAAGLGKKVVQNNQEQFVNRAWEQVELINELNQRLREYLMNLQLNSEIFNSRFNSKYMKDLMLYLQPMKYAPMGRDNVSLSSVMAANGVPSAYVSSAFYMMASEKSLPPSVNPVSLNEKMIEDTIYKWKEHQINDLINQDQIKSLTKWLLNSGFYLKIKQIECHNLPTYDFIDSDNWCGIAFNIQTDLVNGTSNEKYKYPKEGAIYLKKGDRRGIRSSSDTMFRFHSNIFLSASSEISPLYSLDELRKNNPNAKIPQRETSLGAYYLNFHFQYLIEKELIKEGLIDKYLKFLGPKTDMTWDIKKDNPNYHYTLKFDTIWAFTIEEHTWDTFKRHMLFYSIAPTSEAERIGLYSKLSTIKEELDKFLNDLIIHQSEDTSRKVVEQGAEISQIYNPMNSEELARVNQFIKDYYDEFLNNTNLQQGYIEELTHSQYPVMAYPVYPEPVYYYLKQLSEQFILPASGSFPNNSIALFVNNPEFVEAFLSGMNTEMGKELLWREYPTDKRGSYFRKFWDTEVKKDIREELKNDTFFDVYPLHKWDKRAFPNSPQSKGSLGQHHMPGKEELLIFAIKGELMKKYPETIVYLSKAVLKDNVKIVINPDAIKILPDLSAWLGEDLYIVGFPAKLKELVGNPKTKDPGYFLTFMNRPGETRFGTNGQPEVNVGKHAGERAKMQLVQPYMFGKHVSQFLSGWK